jgi:hypothetical protein
MRVRRLAPLVFIDGSFVVVPSALLCDLCLIRALLARRLSRQGTVATQARNGDYQNENRQPEQGKLNHSGVEDASCAFARPCAFFSESGRFESNHQNAPDRGNQPNHQERFRNQNMQANGDAYRMQNKSGPLGGIPYFPTRITFRWSRIRLRLTDSREVSR